MVCSVQSHSVRADSHRDTIWVQHNITKSFAIKSSDNEQSDSVELKKSTRNHHGAFKLHYTYTGSVLQSKIQMKIEVQKLNCAKVLPEELKKF